VITARSSVTVTPADAVVVTDGSVPVIPAPAQVIVQLTLALTVNLPSGAVRDVLA
jgi:hypothetical protein